MKAQHKFPLIILLVVAVVGIYLNRSYAHFFNYVSEHFQTNPTDIVNYTLGTGPIIKYVALGDSLTVGAGTSDRTDSFPLQFAQKITEDKQKIELLNLGQPSGKAIDILNSQITEAINFHPDLITILIGTNDIYDQTEMNTFARELDDIIVKLKSKTKAHIMIANVPQLGAYPALLWPYTQYFDYKTRQLNKIIDNLTTANGLEFVDLYSYNKNLDKTGDNFYSPDSFHPNKNGYRAWAEFFYANYRQ